MNKFLLLSDSYEGYGAEKMLLWLGTELAARKKDISFFSVYDNHRCKGIPESLPFFCLGYDRNTQSVLRYLYYFFVCPFALIRYIRKNKIDCVVTFKENPLCLALIAKLFCGVKHIHSERDDPYNRDTYGAKFKMWLYRFTDHVVFQTKGAQEYYQPCVVNKSVIIPNPVVIPEKCWHLEKSLKTIACVGRLNIRYKRQDVLIKAFSVLDSKFDEWRLVFYGDGDDKLKLERLVSDLKLQNRISFLGKVDNVSERLLRDGLFVLASDTEGMPNALMEAMALGMPVISTDCSPGGAKSLIDNGENGWLVKRASEREMAEALMILLNDKRLRVRLGENARLKMAMYSPSVIYNRWVNYIDG